MTSFRGCPRALFGPCESCENEPANGWKAHLFSNPIPNFRCAPSHPSKYPFQDPCLETAIAEISKHIKSAEHFKTRISYLLARIATYEKLLACQPYLATFVHQTCHRLSNLLFRGGWPGVEPTPLAGTKSNLPPGALVCVFSLLSFCFVRFSM